MRELMPYLPVGIARVLLDLPLVIAAELTEIRLRLDGPLSVTAKGKNYCISKDGKPCAVQNAIWCTEEDIATCLSLLTGGSLYSYGDTLCNGYIPFGKGHRAGVCGEARVKDGKMSGFSSIQGINLRLSRFFPDYGAKAIRYLTDGGLKGALVYSPPNKGKTTLLKSLAYLLSRHYRVGIADERAELYVPSLRAGLTDCIVGLKKSLAIPMLCRSMSPQIIVCDELASDDLSVLLSAVGAGVCIIASAHGDSVEGVAARPFIKSLLNTGAFPLLIGISDGFDYTVEEWHG